VKSGEKAEEHASEGEADDDIEQARSLSWRARKRATGVRYTRPGYACHCDGGPGVVTGGSGGGLEAGWPSGDGVGGGGLRSRCLVIRWLTKHFRPFEMTAFGSASFAV
jgi:hypothetical protein